MAFRQLICCFSLLLTLHTATAQGLILDDERYARMPRQPMYGDGGKSEVSALDGVVKIDLRPFCPRPKHQGQVSSCTGWATGYGAYSIAYAIHNNWEGRQKVVTDSAFSALFLYNQIREDFENCDQGSHIDVALDFLEKSGNVPSREFDSRPNNCKRLPTDEEMQVAGKNRIKDWMTLFSSDASARVKIDKTKLALAGRKPVVIAMRLRNNFSLLNSDSKFWLPMLGDTAFSSPHAMVVVGFDDGKNAFEIMNSWGTSWGNDGFIWVKYSDFAEHVRYAYVMTLPNRAKPKPKITQPNEPPAKTLFGQVNIRYPVNYVDGAAVFEDAAFVYKNGVYQLNEATAAGWPVGKLYQLVLSNTMADSYLYAFSYDATGSAKVHWPRDSKFDEKFDGLNETAIITNPKVKIVVPGEKQGLVLEKTGTEYICLFFSREPIRDFNILLQQIKKEALSRPFPESVQKALGKRMIANKSLVFTPDGVQFETSATIGTIVPVMLQIPVK